MMIKFLFFWNQSNAAGVATQKWQLTRSACLFYWMYWREPWRRVAFGFFGKHNKTHSFREFENPRNLCSESLGLQVHPQVSRPSKHIPNTFETKVLRAPGNQTISSQVSWTIESTPRWSFFQADSESWLLWAHESLQAILLRTDWLTSASIDWRYLLASYTHHQRLVILQKTS